jgi:membrane-bound lytic murein transglycosylase D
MPDETRNYLPKLQALKNIVRDPEKYGLELGDIPDAPYFAVVKIKRKIDVKAAAGLAEMSIDEFQYLNPQHNRPVIAGSRRIHDSAADRQGECSPPSSISPTSRSSRGRRIE